MSGSSVGIGDTVDIAVGTLINRESEPEAKQPTSMEQSPGEEPEKKHAEY